MAMIRRFVRARRPHQLGSMPIVRKIFRQHDSYICALCRTSHQSEDQALHCLNRCWGKTLRLPPVVQIKQKAGMAYKCRFCSRIYKGEQEATACAHDCLDSRKQCHKNDILLYELPAEDIDHHKFTMTVQKVKVQTQQVSRFNLKRFSDEEEKKEDKPEDVEQEEASISQEMSEEEENAAPEDKRRTKDDFPKGAFIRNEAKYECNLCHELYFTKIEVEKCFNDHFDEDGKEILGEGTEPAPA